MTDHKNQFEICVRAIIRRGNKILVCIGKKSGIYSRRRILQPFKAGDECDTFCERSEQYGKIKE